MSIQTFLRRPSGLLRIPGNTPTQCRPNRVCGRKPCVDSVLLASATPTHELNPQKTRQLSTWDPDFPLQNHIEVKNKGKNADWESFEAIVKVHRDRRRRARRVWIPFSGDEPTREELAMQWPNNKQATRVLKLRDEDQLSLDPPEDDKQFYVVTEKLGVDGRLLWREVIPKGEGTAEENELLWKELMEEEGWFDEIDRLMAKD